MIYLCIKDFDKDKVSVKKGEQVDLKFGHDDSGKIYCSYVRQNDLDHVLYGNYDILDHFVNLAKWRNEQIENIIND
jgi:hypothetical protein